MRLGFLALFSFVVLVTRQAEACKCFGPQDVQEVLRDYVVFTGKAMEQLERNWCDEPKLGSAEYSRLGIGSRVTRFRVLQAVDLPIGQDVLVFSDLYRSCHLFYRVGEEELVVARKGKGKLYAHACFLPSFEIVEELRARLEVPDSSKAGRPPQARPFTPNHCEQPATLDDAMQRADAVVWTESHASCVVDDRQDGDLVEHAVGIRTGGRG